MRRDVDVIVVGAGPAGCAAAYDLVEAGLSVRLLDRKTFPRMKPCAGGLTVKALKRLRYSIAPVIRSVTRDVEVSLNHERARRLRGRRPIAVMTVREELDAFCLDTTRARGADFRVVRDIAGIAEDETGVRLTTISGETMSAAFLLGADGANSRVRRLIGAGPPGRTWAIEGLVPADAAAAGPRVMRIDFGCAPDGYGWVFPKGDHLNVGLYSRLPEATFGREDLIAYARRAVGSAAVERIVGHPLGVGGETPAPATRRVLLAGDAAGMTERLLGEGIHNAIRSGQIAATSILAALRHGVAAAAAHHEQALALRRDLHLCARIARRLRRSESLGFSALCSWPCRTALMRGFAAGKTIDEILRSAPLSPFYATSPVPSVTEFESAIGPPIG